MRPHERETVADGKVDAVQPKGATKAEMMLERESCALLAAVLPRSIRERREYGAVMCWNNGTPQRDKVPE